MEEKTVEVNGKKFIVKELLAVDFDKIQDIENTTARIVETIKFSANLSDEDYKTLTIKERGVIQVAMGELNGWTDFQKSEITEEEK